MQLHVNIDEIQGDALEIERDVPAEWLTDILDGDEPTGFTGRGGFRLAAELQKLVGSILLRGSARVRAQAPCKRCLTEVVLELPIDFTLNLIPAGDALGAARARDIAPEEEEPAGTFEPEMADEEIFHGKVIDLGAILREQILLALPMDALCKESCKGLCSVCGQDLNQADCGHDRSVLDPRWAGLKDIKLVRH